VVAGPGCEASARDLAKRESACCSFFTFSFFAVDDVLQLDVGVEAAHVGILEALAARAAARVASARHVDSL